MMQGTSRAIDRIASGVNARGHDDIQEESDDYALLLQSYEFRQLVVFELYDGYFPPRRHEFELNLLNEVVNAVASSPPAAFLAGAVAGGVVGNAAYDVLKKCLAHVARRFMNLNRTRDAVREIAANVEKLQRYMSEHDDITTSQISSDLDIEAHKIEPLLKLLGCQSRCVKKRRLWKRRKSG